MNDIAQRLKALKKAWQGIENMPEDLIMLGLPGKDGRFIEDTIDELACMAAKLMFAPAKSLVMLKFSCEAYLDQLEDFFSGDVSGHASMQMLSFVTLLQQLQTTLREAVTHDVSAGMSNPPEGSISGRMMRMFPL